MEMGFAHGPLRHFDAWSVVARFLRPVDLLRLSAVSREFRDALASERGRDRLWGQTLLHHFGNAGFGRGWRSFRSMSQPEIVLVHSFNGQSEGRR